jgi:parallel beta-helix repeat protein
VYASSRLVVEQNVVRGSAWNGFLIEGTTDSRFTGNTAAGNGTLNGNGFWIRDGSDRNRFTANSATLNYENGFFTTNAASDTFTGNVATDNGPAGGNGFAFLATSDMRVENNVAKGSPWACFGLYEGTNGATLVGNTASGCSAGFDLNGGAYDNTLRGNTANNNNYDGDPGNGFSLEAASANVLSDNTANGNNNGFLLIGANANKLTRNTADGNDSYGFVVVAGASDNTFSHNAAHWNDQSHTDCFDALDVGIDNHWNHNSFGTTAGI